MYKPRASSNGRAPPAAANGGGDGGGGQTAPDGDYSQFAPQPSFYSPPAYNTANDPRVQHHHQQHHGLMQRTTHPNINMYSDQPQQLMPQNTQQQERYAPRFPDPHAGTPPESSPYLPFQSERSPPPPPSLDSFQPMQQQYQPPRSTRPVNESPAHAPAVSPVLPPSRQRSLPPFPSLGSYASQIPLTQGHDPIPRDAQDLSAIPFSHNHAQTHLHDQPLDFHPLPQQHYEQLQQRVPEQHQHPSATDNQFSMFQPSQAYQQQNFDGTPAQQHEQAPQGMHGHPTSQQQPQQGFSFMGLNMNGTSNGNSAYGMSAVPGMPMLLAGMAHQLVSQGAGDGGNVQSIAPHLMQNLGVSQYFSSPSQDSANTFMRLPKYYFEVNHSYVLKKLLLLLVPFTRRSWSRKRAVDQVQFDNNVSDARQAYMPPRDDVNAPDLYIPVMSFVTYFLLVGFIFGTRNVFTAEVLAKYCSKGLGILTLEVLIIKLGLYLINAQSTTWLDVVAYRGYKFVGVILAMVANLIYPKLYYASLGYAAGAMFIFLLRSHRRIILPREQDQRFPAEVAQRNAFLLFICALQFPIYWILILDVRSIVAN